MTMRAAVLTGEGAVTVEDRTRPDPGADEVLVRVGACGVCMTDYHLYHGTFPAPFPVVPGHESAGEVVAVGDAVSGVAVGDRVAVFPGRTCGECDFCVQGKQHLCEHVVAIGGAGDEIIDGSFAEYVRVPGVAVRDVGDLAYDRAAFAEPLACCLHGVDRADPETGDTVVVVGAGPIGLLLVQAFRAVGAGTVVVSEPIAERRALATDLGADYALDPTEAPLDEQVDGLVDRVDVAVEAVGSPATIEAAHGLPSPGGTTLVFGVPPRGETVELDPFDLYYDELSVLGTFASTPHDFSRAVTLLRRDRVAVDPLVTDAFGLTGLEDAFDQMAANEGLKKMVYPGR
jgi:NADPH2:quinone reductase